jgi:hypothetical protein
MGRQTRRRDGHVRGYGHSARRGSARCPLTCTAHRTLYPVRAPGYQLVDSARAIMNAGTLLIIRRVARRKPQRQYRCMYGFTTTCRKPDRVKIFPWIGQWYMTVIARGLSTKLRLIRLTTSVIVAELNGLNM